jgi:hypothetical protein
MNREEQDPQSSRAGVHPSLERIAIQADGAADDQGGDPRPAAVTFVTTEHFVLEGTRAATISEANGRTSVFLGAVSGGLIALGLIGQASQLGTAFYAFALILLPTLAVLGLMTFHRVFQSGGEDYLCAHRIARLRGFYFEAAPEVERYLLSVPPEQRLEAQGFHVSWAQKLLSMAGTVAVITAVLAGSTVGLLTTVVSNHSAWATFPAGAVTTGITLALMIRYLGSQIAVIRRKADDRFSTYTSA